MQTDAVQRKLPFKYPRMLSTIAELESDPEHVKFKRFVDAHAPVVENAVVTTEGLMMAGDNKWKFDKLNEFKRTASAEQKNSIVAQQEYLRQEYRKGVLKLPFYSDDESGSAPMFRFEMKTYEVCVLFLFP